MNNDLWPDFSTETVKTPKNLLIEQANYFNQKFKNVLSAQVTSSNSDPKKIWHTFQIIAPALGNYSYTLFHIRHNVIFYPLELLYQSNSKSINDEIELKEEMAIIFNAEITKKIITSLYSQSINL